jgi:ATP adenylyltransferase
MIVPYTHNAVLAAAAPEDLSEMMHLSQRLQRVLDGLYHPEGYNLGMNLGRAAGAGIPAHLHMHLLPRWTGDTNFMSTVGATRVEPEELGVTYRRMREALDS